MRLRFRFAKAGKVRWTSHRDVARMWERALRRVRLPVAYSEGFSPRPRIGFGLALPTGAESVAEYLDVELVPDTSVEVGELPARLSAALPAGVDVLVAVELARDTASLQHEVTSCTWEIEILDIDVSTAHGLVDAALAAASLIVPRERKGRTTDDDVRSQIRDASSVTSTGSGALVTCDLASQPRALRPTELVTALGRDLEVGRVRRTHQWIERDGARWEPETTDARHDGSQPSFPKDLPDVRTDLRPAGGSPPADLVRTVHAGAPGGRAG